MLFSIVMPAYNSEKTILESIDSIRSQTFTDWELIVVDDGSIDRTRDIVTGLKDERIHVLIQQNSGVSIARNKGVEHASGDIVCFLDSDDIWFPEHLETIVDMKSKYPDATCFVTNYYFGITYEQKRLPIIRGIRNTQDYQYIDNYLQLLCTSDPLIHTSSIAVNKDCFFKIGGFPTNIIAGEDTIAWIKLFLDGNKIIYTATPLSFYNIPLPGERKIRVSDQDSDLFEEEIITLISKYKSQENPLTQVLSNWYKIRSSTYLQHGKNKLARKYCIKSFSHSHQKKKLLIYFLLTLFPSSVSKKMFHTLLQL